MMRGHFFQALLMQTPRPSFRRWDESRFSLLTLDSGQRRDDGKRAMCVRLNCQEPCSTP